MIKEGQFSTEFARAHGPKWEKWIGHLRNKPACGIELGTWMGESAEWALDHIFTHDRSCYVCVDTFEGSEEHYLAGIDCSTIEADARKRLSRFHNVAINKGYSSDILRMLKSSGFGPVDFVYVDAAHDAMNVLRDAVLAFDMLKVGGIMVFDDYEWKVYPDEIDRPKLAVDSFISCYARSLEIIGLGWQVAVVKTA